jgi:hypothetical protein
MKNLGLFFLLILCSCKFSTPDCCDDRPPSVGFSTVVLSFDTQGGINSVSVFVLDGAYWWFEDIQELKSMECNFFKPVEDLNYCSNNYCNEDKNHTMKIECSWFNAVKKDDSTILVSVNKNETGSAERKQLIEVRSGNYVSGFWIKQSAE